MVCGLTVWAYFFIRRFTMSKFVCMKCSGVELVYEKWVYCEEKVVLHDDGHIEYGKAAIDEDNALGVGSCYKCGSCDKFLSLYGSHVDNESDLKYYLSMSHEDIIAMEEILYRDEDTQDECLELGELYPGDSCRTISCTKPLKAPIGF